MKIKLDPWCLVVAAASVTAKLVFSFHVYGTNDVNYWMHFAALINKHGTFAVYGLEKIYNHPPLISWYLKGLPLLMQATHLGFPFLFRLLPILADCGSLWLIWRLLQIYGVKRRRLVFTLCALNPVSFLISAFHGNTDPVFVFLLLWTVYLLEVRRPAAAGAVYGLSLCIKIVPVLAAPFLILRLSGLKNRVGFVVSALLVTVAVFLPYLFHDFQSVAGNIFGYSSLRGIWGFGHIFQAVVRNPDLPVAIRISGLILYHGHVVCGMGIYLLLMTAAFLRLKASVWTFAEGVFFAFCLFLVVTPGFGVQYLVWPVFLSMLVLPMAATVYSVVAGIFLYRVYTFWSGGFPMNDANSDLVGPWVGFEKLLDLAVWATLLFLLLNFTIKKIKYSKLIL